MASEQSKISLNSSYLLGDAYTDSPKLHPNPIIGSLHLLFWLVLHPSAWHNHVRHIDSNLRSDFYLAELSRIQWRNPALWRFLIQIYIILPALASILTGLIRWQWEGDITAGITSIIIGLAFSIAFGITVGVTGSIAGSVAGSVVGSMVVGSVGNVTFTLAVGIAVVIAGSIAGGVTGNIVTPKIVYTLGRQITGILISIVISLVVILFFRQVIVILGDAAYIGTGVLAGIVAVGWRLRDWKRSLAGAIIVGLAVYVIYFATDGVVDNVKDAIVGGVVGGALFVIPYAFAVGIAGPWIGALVGVLGSFGFWTTIVAFNEATLTIMPRSLIGIMLGLTFAWWLPVCLYIFLAVWHSIILRLDEQRDGSLPHLLRLHAAFWAEHQRIRWYGLDEHVFLIATCNSVEGKAAIEYLSNSRQAWAARETQIKLDIHPMQQCESVESIACIYNDLAVRELTDPANSLLRSLSRISRDVDAALKQESTYNQRLALTSLEGRLDDLQRELTRSSERYAARFYPIVQRWQQIIRDYITQLTSAVEVRQEIDNPYIIGVPLTEKQEIFVGRSDITKRLEQLLLDRRCPPLLLYGQRRMGKTSLLNNLGRLLPSTIVPLFVDLQGPAARATDYSGFLFNIVRQMVESAQQHHVDLPKLSREKLDSDPFTVFDEWLDEVDIVLAQNTALLALDEFEALDKAISRGRYVEEDVFGTLRNIIQHRSRFKVLLTGSHVLEEFQRWSSYLINVQVVHISYLKENEARQLIERPVPDFALRYQPDASQLVIYLTRCHPFLVQLLCAEIVTLKNEQEVSRRRLATTADVEMAVPEALNSGSFFFADIERNQVDETGLAFLRYLAAKGETVVASQTVLDQQFSEHLDTTVKRLVQRELIERVNGGYRFQVELIRRWFARSE